VENATKVGEFINTPRIILHRKENKFSPGWILFEFIDGKLMAEKMLSAERDEKNKDYKKRFLRLEAQKELILNKMHEQTIKTVGIKKYLNVPANRLFYRRICGERLKQFYNSKTKNISDLFDFKISVNGKCFKRTINQVFSDIVCKYKNLKLKEIPVFLGHGDAHHGNIIVSSNDELFFIDNEYAGYLSPLMELAKPYYNDFIGTLFFHYHDPFREYFEVEKVRITRGRIDLRIAVKKEIRFRLRITQTKLDIRKKLIEKTKKKDILSFNDYLVMCHTLTRDPNDYPLDIQYLFLVFTVIMAEFDPFQPNSVYSYF
jgi:thiamine kinase-like enzyme